MSKKKNIVFLLFVLFAIGCTKKITNIFNYEYIYFCKSKAEIFSCLDSMYIVDTVSITLDTNSLFAVVSDFGSGEHIVEVDLFVINHDNLAQVLNLRNIKTSKVKFQIDEVNERLLILSKSEKELISIPFQSFLFNQNHMYFDD